MPEEKKGPVADPPKCNPDSKQERFTKDKGKGRFNRGKSSALRESGRGKFRPGNDFTFWNEYPELMSVAANYPWMHIKGTPLSALKFNVLFNNVFVQHYQPIPGIQDNSTSPLNLAFRQMYLDMHRKYRGIGAYQASDIAITVLCIESVLQMIVEAERVYGILNSIPIKTRMQPDGLLLAMGYQQAFIDDIKLNQANFRYEINRMISLARRLPLPKGMSFFANHVALNGFVYTDSKDERASLLVFVSDGFFEYQTTGDSSCINSSGTAVLSASNRSAWYAYYDMIGDIETQLNKLMYDSDVLRITSDFIACYGEENMQVLVDMPEDYKVIPTYDESILLKFHNSERTGHGVNSYIRVSSSTTPVSGYCVYQENDIVYSLPASITGTLGWGALNGRYYPYGSSSISTYERSSHLVDTWQSDPDVATRCEAVLWKGESSQYTIVGSGNGLSFRHISTELMTTLMIYQVSNGALSSGSPILQPSDVYTLSNASSGYQACADRANFDWAPPVFLLDGNTLASASINKILGDTDNCTVVTSDVISKIIDAALLSAFKVKATGSKGDR